MQSSKRTSAYLFCVLAMVGWGSNFVAAKIVTQAVSGLTLLFFRYLIASLILLFVYRKRPRPKLTGQDKRNILLIGVFGYCGSIALQMVGVSLSASSMASIINTMTPVAIIVFAVPLLGERASLQQVIGILLTVAGSIVIVGSGGGESRPLGIALSFVGMVLWGLTSVWIRRSRGNVDGVFLTIYGTLVGLAADVPLMAADIAINGVQWDKIDGGFWLAILWSGAVATAGANLWWNRGLESLPAATCSLFYALLPVVSTVLGILILHERPTLQFLLGGLVIVAGVVIAILGERRRAESAKTAETTETSQLP